MAVEAERECWVKVSMPLPVAPKHLLAVRTIDPSAAGESAQSFVARVRNAPQLRLGPFSPRYRALAALRKLADAGLDATLELPALT